MTRPYPHRPDEAWIRRRFANNVRRIGMAASTLTDGRGDEHVANAGIDSAFEAAANGWYLGDEPVPVLRGYFTQALPLVRYGIERPATQPPEPGSVIRRIVMSELAGDLALAARAGSVDPPPAVQQPGNELCPLLSLLATGHDDLARPWAAALGSVVQNPATGPEAGQAFGWLAEIAQSVIARDQAGFEASLRARGASTAAYYGRSGQLRRHWLGLLDQYAAGLALFGVQRGLTLPDDVPSVPVRSCWAAEVGYTLELRAISLSALSAELFTPTLSPATLTTRAGLDDEVVQSWGVLASTMSSALRTGGGEVVPPLAGYLRLVIQQLGHWYGALWHTSSGGLEFRASLLPGPVAAVYGDRTATALVNRELFGLTYTGYPMFGWLSHQELTALAQIPITPDTVDDARDETEAVWTLADAITRAAATGQDLITIYS